MRQWRVFERLQPRAVTPTVWMRNAIRIECHIECAGNHSEHPYPAQLYQVMPSLHRPLRAREPREEHVVGTLGRHRPGRRVQKGCNWGNPPLQQKRGQHHACPEHSWGVSRALRSYHLPAHQQAQQINRIEACESRLPKAHAVQFSCASPPGIVIRQHET